MRAALGPAHRLPFREPLGHDLVDRAFHEPRRDPLARPEPLAIIDDVARAAVYVDLELPDRGPEPLQLGPALARGLVMLGLDLLLDPADRLFRLARVSIPEQVLGVIEFTEALAAPRTLGCTSRSSAFASASVSPSVSPTAAA